MNVLHALRSSWALVAAVLVTSCALEPVPPLQAVIDEAPRLLARRVAAPAPPALPPRPLDVASWYGEWHHGLPTASGEPFDMGALTAAHRSLPLGACVEVTHLASGRRVHVRVNDRGPYVPGRTIDLSHRAAAELGMVEDGLARVRIRSARAAICDAGSG